MADAVVSMVVERIGSIVEQRIGEEVNLVRGFDSKIVNLSQELKTIRLVLDDAEEKGLVETGDKAVRNWLKKLENASYELDDVLDEWYTALREFQIQQNSNANAHHVPDPNSYKVCSYTSFISCSCFHKLAVRRGIAKKLEKLKENIDSILEEKDRHGLVMMTATPHLHEWRVQSTPFVDLAEIYGRDIERDELVRRVISPQTNQLQILSVVGVGGVGKTTLAQLVYNDSQVTDRFKCRIWISVSDPFNEVRVAKNIIENVTGKSPPDSDQLGFLLGSLKECILGKKFLLVMDDAWTEESSKWEQLKTSLKNGSIGSKVLVTTRNEEVAKMMGSLETGIQRLGVLSDENCWLLLQRIALSERDEGEWEKFEGIGRNIANKCKGLPLAVKVLGSLLRLKDTLEEWEDVYNSEIWELEKARVELFPHLLLSYNELAPSLKRCFSYCAVFPKDTEINVEELIGHWMALGYLGSDGIGTGDMELKGRKYFNNLAMRFLLQDFQKNYLDGKIEYFKMHDIVHDFARLLREKEGEGMEIKNTSTCKACTSSLVSRAKEYRSIYFDNKEIHWPRCSCVTNLRVVSLEMEFDEKQRIGHEIERFIHLRWLDLSHNDLAAKDLKTICRLYNLQTLLLNHCNLKEITREIGNLIHLRHLNLEMNRSLMELPKEIGNLIRLRHLNLSMNVSLNELPREIGNLIHLRHLNLSENRSLKELPESICDLQKLQRLNIERCHGICRLPQGFHRLVNLKHFHNAHNESLEQFPLQGLAQLTNLRTLSEFNAGSGRSKLGWLKNLDRLSGYLRLRVWLPGSENIVEDAKEGELRKKNCIQGLHIIFNSRLDGDLEWVSLLDALEPQPNIMRLGIHSYGGSKLPSWMVSPLNHLKFIDLKYFSELSSLPPLGRLPCLEDIVIWDFKKMEVVGPEFLGTTTEGSNGSIVFPKLTRLTFKWCDNWREWEDITTTQEEEVDSAVSLVMPCLKELIILECCSLTALPHRLLHKVSSSSSSLEKLNISGSTLLETRYGDRDGSAWKSISEVCPRLQLEIRE